MDDSSLKITESINKSEVATNRSAKQKTKGDKPRPNAQTVYNANEVEAIAKDWTAATSALEERPAMMLIGRLPS